MKKAKKLLALFLALTMIFSTVSILASSVDFRGENSYFKDYGANLNDGNEDSFVYTSKFYKQDADGNWVETTTAAPGENVVVRVTLTTDYPTSQQVLIAVWDSDMFTDSLDSTKLEATLSLNTDASSYAVQHSMSANSFYTAYSNGAGYWDQLHNDPNTDTENYISDEVYAKYQNSWVYIVTANASPTDYAVNPGNEWLFEIPLTVKSEADLGSTTSGSFMIVADAWSSYDIDQSTDAGPTIIAGVNNESGDMGFWYDWDSESGLRPHFDLNDATLSLETSATTADVTFAAGADDAVLTGTAVYDDATIGDTVAVPTAARTGYTLTGWTSDNANVADLAADATSATVSEDVTYTAQWTANTHNVIYKVIKADGTVEDYNTAATAFGTAISPIALPSATGYSYSAWTLADSTAVPATMPDADVTLYTVETAVPYTITINDADGNEITTITKTIADTLTLEEIEDAVEAEGYELDEIVGTGMDYTGAWVDVAGNAVSFPVTNISSALTLTPAGDIKTITVIFAPDEAAYDEDDASTFTTATYSFGADITYPGVAAKRGYTFNGWWNATETEDTAMLAADWAETATDADDEDCILYYGSFTKASYSLTVNYVMADGTTAPEAYTDTVEYEATYSVASPEVTGYTPDTATVTGTMSDEDAEITVTYTANQYTLTVSYTMPDGTTAPETHTESVAYNSTYTVTPPEVTGYTASPATVTGTMDSTAGKTVEVTYTANNYTLTVNYVMADGSEAPAAHTEEVAYNTAYTVASPALTGYTASPETVTGTMDDVNGKTVTVTYNANKYTLTYETTTDGTTYDVFNTAIEKEYNQTIAPIYSDAQHPAKSGYDFSGWTWYNADTNEEIAKPASGAKMPAYNIVVKGTFTIQKFDITVTYVTPEGVEAPAAYTTTDVDYGTAYNIPSPTINGYTPDITAVTGTLTADVNVTVTYSAVTSGLTINYVYEDGTTAAAQYVDNTITYGTAYSVASPVLTGYTASPATVTGTMGTDPVVVTVTYTAKDCSFTYTDNDGEHTVTGKFGTSVPAITAAEKEGWHFVSWSPEMPATFAEGMAAVTANYEIDTHTVNITYTVPEGFTAPAAVSETLDYNTAYSYASPEVTGCHLVDATQATIAGNATADVNVTVAYAVDTHTVKVTYVVPEGFTAPAAVEDTYNYNEAYSYASPEVTGCHLADATQATIAGNATADVDVTVTYAVDTHTVNITYTVPEGYTAPAAVSETLNYNTAYSYASPVVEHCHLVDATQATIAGNATEDVNVTVAYAVDTYNVKVTYVVPEGYTAPAAVDDTLAYGAAYSYDSKTIANLHLVDAAQATIAGTVEGDVDVTVNYAVDQYKLTINYKYEDGTEAAPTSETKVDYNTAYSVGSPTINGYTANYATIAGIMGNEDAEYTVTYTAIPAGALVIHYVDADGNTLAEDYTDTGLNYNDTYSVASPDVEGYTPDTATVTGTMGLTGAEVTVTYTINQYTLTINYVLADGEVLPTGTTLPESYTATLDYKADYSVASPEVTGFTVDTATVTGTMPADNVTVNVKYSRILPKLVARDATVTTVDRDNGIVYGFADADGDVYVTLDKLQNTFLTVEGDGYMVVTPSYTYNSKGLYGTGAVVTVYDNVTGLPVPGETFTVIVYGDINGDGRITSADTSAVRGEIAGVTGWSETTGTDYNAAKTLAADANHNGHIDSGDVSAVRNNIAYVAFIDQNP